jgi:hypothetical protein
VRLACQVAPPASPDSISDIFGTQKTVQASNPITFDRFTSKFANFLLIEATLATSNATYDVYLYDDSGNLLVYATGLTPVNGQIQLYWDLTDGQGHQISFGNIQAAFYIHPPVNLNAMHPIGGNMLKSAIDTDDVENWLAATDDEIAGAAFLSGRTTCLTEGARVTLSTVPLVCNPPPK